MKIKVIYCYLTISLFLIIGAWLGAEQTEQISRESPSTTFLNEAEIDSPITISGKSNLAPGAIINLLTFAKVSSLAGGRFELINTYRTAIEPSGQWRYQIKLAQETPFVAEMYRIDITAGTKTIYSCYFSIASPLASKQRQQEIHGLYQIALDIWNLDRELNESINSIENIKQGKTGWERSIQQTLGIYNKPGEALALAIKKWREWEPGYIKKMEILTDSIGTRPPVTNFVTSQERLSYLAGYLYERYAQYRAQLLGAPRKISYYPAISGAVSPADTKNDALTIMEEEIVSKLFQDTLSLMEYIDENHPSAGIAWPKMRDESVKLCTTLKNEMEYYYRMGLFYRPPNKNFLKESQDLSGLLDALSALLEKTNSPDEKTKHSEEIRSLVTELHNKTTALSAEIY